MDREGEGRTPPARVTYRLNQGDMSAILGGIRRMRDFRGYGNRGRGEWDDGMMGTFSIPGVGAVSQSEAPIFAGKIGEYAANTFLNRRLRVESCVLDMVLRPKGDEGVDIEIYGCTGQVKCRTGAFDSSFVRVKDSSGRDTFPTAEIIVFCEWKKSFSVDLLGWCFTRQITQYYERPAPRGRHINRPVPDCDLKPMSALIDELLSRREAASWR